MKKFLKKLRGRVTDILDYDCSVCPLWVALMFGCILISFFCGIAWFGRSLGSADERFDNIVAILPKQGGAQGRNLYRFAMQLTNSTEIPLKDASTENVRFFADVPAGQPMWYVEKKVRHPLCIGSPYSIEVHIHSARDLPGVGLGLNSGANPRIAIE